MLEDHGRNTNMLSIEQAAAALATSQEHVEFLAAKGSLTPQGPAHVVTESLIDYKKTRDAQRSHALCELAKIDALLF